MDFRSDNIGEVCGELAGALQQVNHGTSSPYGDDPATWALNGQFSELFERQVVVFPVATGTAANSLALAALTPPYGAVACHELAHIHTAEANAVEFYSGGAKLMPLIGPEGKLDLPALCTLLAENAPRRFNRPKISAISISQATELGTVYQPEEIAAIRAAAAPHGVKIHMDGARFANALATLKCTPAAVTWRAGIDILSFGVTKNGGMYADAIVLFDLSLADDLAYRIRRGGHTWSKMRYASAQLSAYVSDGLYLRLAERANQLASSLADRLAQLESVEIIAPVNANEVFARFPAGVLDELSASGVQFYRRAGNIARFICRCDGAQSEVDALVSQAARSVARVRRDRPSPTP